MESKSPPGSVRRHAPRRSVRGPLTTADDPLANPPESPLAASTHTIEPAPSISVEESRAPEQTRPQIDLHFLQDAQHYLPIPTEDVHDEFLRPERQPGPDVPLANLLQHGHFRHAAQKAIDELVDCPSDDATRIFQLLYTRFACLILITRPDIASQEAASLLDFLSRGPAAAEEVLPLVPWELRLLLVRLQSMVAADGGRRGIMALYNLAAEVRQHVQGSREADRLDDVQLWSDRLRDVGLRVCDALVEMGELETATRHLDTLVGVDEDEIAYRKALIRLRLGDRRGAQGCVEQLRDEAHKKDAIAGLLEVLDGNWDEAVRIWQKHGESASDNALATANLAVGLLYTGRLMQAKDLLESLTERAPAFSGALFNLATVYELCTEQATDRKLALAQQVASKEPSADTGGWERLKFEFKL